MVKSLISLILFLMMVFIVIGCSTTMTPEQRKELYQEREGRSDLSSTVGRSPFVGSTKPQPGTLRYHEMFGY
jgi:hypothetical protein